MIPEDRDKYLQKCKTRALAYLPDTQSAITSMMSDLRKHPDFARVAETMSALAVHCALRGTEEDVRRFIVGFR